MKRIILLVAVAAGAALFGLSGTAKPNDGFSVQLYGSGYSPGGYYYASPSYYYVPRYYSYYSYPYSSYYSYPSYGYSYYRPYYSYSYYPGFSLSIGRGWGGRGWGYHSYRPWSSRYYRW